MVSSRSFTAHSISPRTMLEIWTGEHHFPVSSRFAMYLRSQNIPCRTDLIKAVVSGDDSIGEGVPNSYMDIRSVVFKRLEPHDV